jgi:hypothetical protein
MPWLAPAMFCGLSLDYYLTVPIYMECSGIVKSHPMVEFPCLAQYSYWHQMNIGFSADLLETGTGQ